MIVRATIVIVPCALVVGLLASTVDAPSPPSALDVSVARWAAELPQGLTFVWRPLTSLGASITVGVLLAIVAALSFRRERNVLVLVFLGAVLVGEIALTNLIKAGVDRARPEFDQLVDVTSSAYPSGHAAAAAAAYTAIALVLSRGRPRALRRRLLAGAVAIAVVVASTRVLLGVHWVTDAIGGLALGWAWVTLCALVLLGPAGAAETERFELSRDG